MNARGKIIYESYCVSCHQVNLSGAENWKGLDDDGHRKAPPLNGTGHTWHHDELCGVLLVVQLEILEQYYFFN